MLLLLLLLLLLVLLLVMALVVLVLPPPVLAAASAADAVPVRMTRGLGWQRLQWIRFSSFSPRVTELDTQKRFASFAAVEKDQIRTGAESLQAMEPE